MNAQCPSHANQAEDNHKQCRSNVRWALDDSRKSHRASQISFTLGVMTHDRCDGRSHVAEPNPQANQGQTRGDLAFSGLVECSSDAASSQDDTDAKKDPPGYSTENGDLAGGVEPPLQAEAEVEIPVWIPRSQSSHL